MQIGIREASRNLSKLVNQAAYSQDPIVLTSHSRPKAVLLSYERYQELVGPRENAETLARARRLRAEFEAQHGVFSEDLIQLVRAEREQALLPTP